jgi:hypothetical protein
MNKAPCDAPTATVPRDTADLSTPAHAQCPAGRPGSPAIGASPEPGTGAGITCLAAGTMVVTARGEIPADNLRVGEMILTMHGVPGRQPLIHVARRRVSWSGRPDAASLAPILIRAGALMRGAPIRDLRVSPGQGILLDGCLVPARLLVNGTTIVQEAATDGITYVYLWLETHGVLIADGTLTESGFEDGARRDFADAANVTPLMPLRPGHLPAEAMERCLPLLLEGPALDRIRQRLATRAREAGTGF